MKSSNSNIKTPCVGKKIIASIVAEINEHTCSNKNCVDYNERYIDGGPAWQEHINYFDGGQHGETHRPN